MDICRLYDHADTKGEVTRLADAFISKEMGFKLFEECWKYLPTHMWNPIMRKDMCFNPQTCALGESLTHRAKMFMALYVECK